MLSDPFHLPIHLALSTLHAKPHSSFQTPLLYSSLFFSLLFCFYDHRVEPWLENYPLDSDELMRGIQLETMTLPDSQNL